MRVLLDACVLVPTLTRALVLDLARLGGITPLWSPQILAEWSHAAKRSGPVEALAVSGEIARLNALYPDANTEPDQQLIQSLTLPDPNDTHVLAAAIAAPAPYLCTFNARDFPTRALAHHGITRISPDALLLSHLDHPDFAEAAHAQLARAQEATGTAPRALLKKSHLPRFAKALIAR